MSFTPGLPPVAPAPPARHAFGLPAGSVRALLALSVLGLLWLLALRPLPGHSQSLGDVKLRTAFMDLQILMVLILANFFAAHGNSIRAGGVGRSPLHLPRGSVRFLLLAGYVGLAAFLYHTEPQFEYPSTSTFFLLLVLLSAFFLGHVLTGAILRVSGGVLPFWFQDVQAWAALLAILCMGILVLGYGFINLEVSRDLQLDLSIVEAVLAGLVGFYFGARS